MDSEEGDAPGQLRTPVGLAADNEGGIYVTDFPLRPLRPRASPPDTPPVPLPTGRVQHLSTTGEVRGEWLFNRPGDEHQPYNPQPVGVAVVPDGTAFAATVTGDSSSRSSVQLWRLPHSGSTPLAMPDTKTDGEFRGLAAGAAGELYLATDRPWVTTFSAAGATLAKWDVPQVMGVAAWPLDGVYVSIRELGRSRLTVYRIIPDEQASMSTAPVVTANGTFVKGSGPDIFLVREGERWRLPDMDTFLALGGLADLSNVMSLSEEELRAIPRGCDLELPPVPDGAFVKSAIGPDIYVMQYGERSWIPSWDGFLALGGQADLSNVIVLAEDALWDIPKGPIAVTP